MLHRLRSLAHVIDMHQLTKDPERIRARYSRTAESVRDTMTAEELFHYLDYCSEMLSLVGKSAALYAQSTSDDVVLTSIEGIESLTTGLQTKIWQKIALLP
ncbi:hypothetical protein [Mobilicoccus massiliensis]|uniref:hypothetical protein n=1 Tax=Mobilicoccus massiliensis TaxID=1522310 RepID=UPI0006945F8F|nr:hypothetical protein [Mobilicoccus massiliensis]